MNSSARFMTIESKPVRFISNFEIPSRPLSQNLELRYVIGRKYRYLQCLIGRFYWPSMHTATLHTCSKSYSGDYKAQSRSAVGHSMRSLALILIPKSGFTGFLKICLIKDEYRIWPKRHPRAPGRHSPA